MERAHGTKKIGSQAGLMWDYQHQVFKKLTQAFRKQSKLGRCWCKMDTNLIFVIHQFWHAPSKHSTTQQTNSIAIIFQLWKIGDWMKGTMELSKDSTNWKQCRSMEKSKCRFGDEATIFHHHHLRSMMKGILNLTDDTKILNLKSCHWPR